MSNTFYGGGNYQSTSNGPYVDPFLASAINFNKQKSKHDMIESQKKERNLEEVILKQISHQPK